MYNNTNKYNIRLMTHTRGNNIPALLVASKNASVWPLWLSVERWSSHVTRDCDRPVPGTKTKQMTASLLVDCHPMSVAAACRNHVLVFLGTILETIQRR